MRIIRLKVLSYGNLQDFEFIPEANEVKNTTVVLGRNGAGKSNLIEVIVEVFRDLEDKKPSDFYYEIEYEIRGIKVQVFNNPDSSPKQKFFIDDIKLAKKGDFNNGLDTYLPKYVFSYYSGWNQRLERLFEKPTNRLYQAWKSGSKSDNIPLRRMFYCRKDYSQLVLLAFFLMDDDQKIKDFLYKFLNIENFESALFVLHRPFWSNKSKIANSDLENGDSLFWYAKGAFLNFTDRLWRHCLAPIRNEEQVTKDFRDRKEDHERLYLYIKDIKTLKEMKYPGEDETHFFAHLEGLYLCDLLDQVRVTVKHTKAGFIRFEQLSEGEQQLLTVLGLLNFTKGEESLFLLDEPDTHLNPSWTYEYLNLLESQVEDTSSQMIIASHNPLMIGGLKKEQVRLLRRKESKSGYKTVAEKPEEDPIGMGVDGLLQSEVFGLRSVLPPKIVQKLTNRYKLLGIKNKTKKMEDDLRELTKELDSLGVATSFPHPYFDYFSSALAKHTKFQQNQFSMDELDDLEAFTAKLISEAADEHYSKGK
ncbi:AAA family ATPase [Alteromonas macleodii]|uniref:AAA family ATPase n=1 Tax=Alteromonas macleodii TaxID=28108 RepID=UPI00068BA254|nr:AAA family ATPase [Alteromonas macleodii]